MSAKAFCKKTAAYIGWFIQNLPSEIDGTWLNDPDATKEHLAAFTEPSPPFFTVTSVANLPAVPAKRRGEHVGNGNWGRAYDFDSHFKTDQPATDACKIATYKSNKAWNPSHMVAKALGREWVERSAKEIGEEIIRRCLTITNAQGGVMMDEAVKGNNPWDLSLDIDCGNFFFAETGDTENPVVIVRLYLCNGVLSSRVAQNAHVWRLDDGGECDAKSRFLLCKLKVASTI